MNEPCSRPWAKLKALSQRDLKALSISLSLSLSLKILFSDFAAIAALWNPKELPESLTKTRTDLDFFANSSNISARIGRTANCVYLLLRSGFLLFCFVLFLFLFVCYYYYYYYIYLININININIFCGVSLAVFFLGTNFVIFRPKPIGKFSFF